MEPETADPKYISPSRKRKKALADRLIAILADGQWHNRKSLQGNLFGTARNCRYARQYGMGKVIFGPKGYKLTSAATVEELNHCKNTLDKNAKLFILERDMIDYEVEKSYLEKGKESTQV